MSSPPNKENATSAGAPNSPGDPIRLVNLSELLGSRRELHIEHDGARYVLRLTRQNKLILTK